MGDAEEKELRELKSAMGFIVQSMTGSMGAFGIVFLGVALYELWNGRVYMIGWVIAAVTLPIAIGAYFLGRWLGELIYWRKKNRRWPYK